MWRPLNQLRRIPKWDMVLRRDDPWCSRKSVLELACPQLGIQECLLHGCRFALLFRAAPVLGLSVSTFSPVVCSAGLSMPIGTLLAVTGLSAHTKPTHMAWRQFDTGHFLWQLFWA